MKIEQKEVLYTDILIIGGGYRRLLCGDDDSRTFRLFRSDRGETTSSEAAVWQPVSTP